MQRDNLDLIMKRYKLLMLSLCLIERLSRRHIHSTKQNIVQESYQESSQVTESSKVHGFVRLPFLVREGLASFIYGLGS